MKPLKRTTALAALSTSSLALSPQAFAAGENVVAAAPTFPIIPVVIAAASVAAVAGFVGWGMKARKYRRLEDTYNRHQTQKALRPATRHYSSRQLAAYELEATFASRLRGDSQIILPPDASQGGTSKASQQVSFRQVPVQQFPSRQAPAPQAYVPAHAKRQTAPATSKAFVPGVTSSDMLASLEEKYSDIINKETALPQVASVPRVENRSVYEGALTEAGARSGRTRAASEAPEEREPNFVRLYERSFVDAADFGINNNMRIAHLVPRVDEYRLAPSIDGDDSFARAMKAVSRRREREAVAAEIAEAGKRAEQATAQAALAVKSAGQHAAYDVKAQEKADPVVPVRRGPGFVDVNDSTFVRSGSRGVPHVVYPIKKAAGAEGLSQGVPVYPQTYVTDAVSDFPMREMNMTYFTQGDMVNVQYGYGSGWPSQGGSGAGRFVVHGGNNGSTSGFSSLRTSVTALPVV